MEAIAPAITVIGYIVLFILKGWFDGKPERQADERKAFVAEIKNDIATNNAVAIGVIVDSLRDNTTGNAPKLSTDEDTKRRLTEITGI